MDVAVAHFTHNLPTVKLVSEHAFGFKTTEPSLSTEPTRLVVLRSVDAVQADAHTVQFKGVPVDGPRQP